jgi:hypothetical protein
MVGSEVDLFTKVDSARQSKGCAPLGRNSGLTGKARAEAADRADSGQFATSGSKASTGGKDMSAQAAFDQLMNQSSGTVLNCGLDELGVGRGTAEYCPGICLFGLGKATRVGWVVSFN